MSTSRSSADRFKTAATSRAKKDGEAPTRGVTAKRTKPVRVTIDLTPADYQVMREMVAELARLTDIPTLPHSNMWRALLRSAAGDAELLASLAAQIKADRS